MRNKLKIAGVAFSLLSSQAILSSDDLEALKKEFELLKQNYEQRIQLLEKKLEKAQTTAEEAKNTAQQATHKEKIDKVNVKNTENSFNPAISLILDGRYADFENDPAHYHIPGFSSGGDAALGKDGFSLGHTELTASANIDEQFYGEMTLALHDYEGETEVELEQAYVQTLGLGNGFTVKAGRFYSSMGYMNEQHAHAWDFADAPLIYRGLFGGHNLTDDGLHISYIAPTDLFIQAGAELTSGDSFPAANSSKSVGAWNVFANIGGDIGIEHSWSLGLSHWKATDINNRTSGGHSHGDAHAEEGYEENDELEEHTEHDEHEDHEEHGSPAFSGESKINAIDFIYKWAPNGNPKNKNFKFQFEYFIRKEDGILSFLDSDPFESSFYKGDQSGFYAQAIYQFKPQWRTGIRYDYLNSDNKANDELLEEAGLHDEGHNPKRYSAMFEWVPSEYSRIRLQFNHDKSYEESDNQVFLQYTYSLGSHGAHLF